VSFTIDSATASRGDGVALGPADGVGSGVGVADGVGSGVGVGAGLGVGSGVGGAGTGAEGIGGGAMVCGGDVGTEIGGEPPPTMAPHPLSSSDAPTSTAAPNFVRMEHVLPQG